MAQKTATAKRGFWWGPRGPNMSKEELRRMARGPALARMKLSRLARGPATARKDLWWTARGLAKRTQLLQGTALGLPGQHRLQLPMRTQVCRRRGRLSCSRQ